jgi:hypothetical protein
VSHFINLILFHLKSTILSVRLKTAKLQKSPNLIGSVIVNAYRRIKYQINVRRVPLY